MASFVSAQIGNEVFIKFLNQANKFQHTSTIGYQKSIALLPIYMDEDYYQKPYLEDEVPKDK